ncbi:hypothetical protein [Shimia sp.]|uniref:hypothetical protein n=1 Tax=Shimia sp. TaxID=1954381 RepID=UPI003299A9E5
MSISYTAAAKQIRALGFRVSRLDGEIRVGFPGNESAAYYTTDPADALATAQDMARRAEAGAVPVPDAEGEAIESGTHAPGEVFDPAAVDYDLDENPAPFGSVELSSAESKLIRQFARDIAARWTGRRDVKLEPGIRTSETGESVNVNLIDRTPDWEDSDLADHIAWSDLRRDGLPLDAAGTGETDIYIYTAAGLAANMQIEYDRAGLVAVHADAERRLWTRDGAEPFDSVALQVELRGLDADALRARLDAETDSGRVVYVRAALEALEGAETPARLLADARNKYAALRRSGASALEALGGARQWQADPNRAPVYTGESIWKRPAVNSDFEAHGESRVRWFEDPEKSGLRLVGLAHDAAPGGHAYYRAAVDHSGWYLTPDNWSGETVAGVVYRLPGANGRARYLAGYADPYQTDKHGNGPALLSLEVFTGETLDSSWDQDSALRDVARRADGIAENMAEQEREYQTGHGAGRAARELAAEALEAAKRWTQAVRAARAVFRNRHRIDRRDRRLLMRAQVEQARDHCGEYLAARKAARKARADAPSGRAWENEADGFRNGYQEGV